MEVGIALEGKVTLELSDFWLGYNHMSYFSWGIDIGYNVTTYGSRAKSNFFDSNLWQEDLSPGLVQMSHHD